ncbi:MAG: DUF5990 family protein [Bryobacteraceae bacterium]|jgi:hypothetical protein
MERELMLRVVLERPPAGVDFGLQNGRGSAYETIQKQRLQSDTAGADGIDLRFEFTLRVKARGNDPIPAFLGPLVQGPSRERFVYIDIGTYAGQTDTFWSRRLKIPLGGITWEMIELLGDHPATVLEARVPGAARDGGPNCGTAKLLEGWRLNNAPRG